MTICAIVAHSGVEVAHGSPPLGRTNLRIGAPEVFKSAAVRPAFVGFDFSIEGAPYTQDILGAQLGFSARLPEIDEKLSGAPFSVELSFSAGAVVSSSACPREVDVSFIH